MNIEAKKAIDHSFHNKTAEPQEISFLYSSVINEGFSPSDVYDRFMSLLKQNQLYMRNDGRIENGIDANGNEFTRQLPLPTFDEREQELREKAFEPIVTNIRRQQDIFIAKQEVAE